MPSVRRADGSNDDNGGIAALANGINGLPTIAFPVPSPSTIVTCTGPVDIIWFHAGAFGTTDLLFDLYLTNVGVPQNPPVSGSSSTTSTVFPSAPAAAASVTVTIAQSQQVLATNHFYAWQKVALPSGYYIINGTSVDTTSKVVFLPSSPFFIAPGADTSCISINPSLPRTTATTTSPSPSSTPTAAQLQPEQSDASSPTDTPLNEAHTTSVDHRTKVIAGSVAGSLAIVLIIAVVYILLYMRRHRRTYYPDPEAAVPGKWRRLQRISSKPTPILPPPPVPPSSPIGGANATSVYLTVPTVRFPSEARGADSFTTQRSQLQARWGWAMPLTPMFGLLAARRSSVGSDRFMSPAGAGLETPLPSGTSGSFAFWQAQTQRGERSPLPSASFMQRSRMTSLAGLDVHMSEYERDRLHSLSEFRWVEGFPDPALNATVERLDTVEEKDTPTSTPTKEKK